MTCTPSAVHRRLRLRPTPRNRRCCECSTAYCTDKADEDVAVVLLGGDKTRLANLWYPPNINEAEYRLDHYCRHHPDLNPIVKRGDR